MASVDIDPECKQLIKLAAEILKGSQRSAFMAEVASPKLEQDICALADSESQTDPQQSRSWLFTMKNLFQN
ncbi:hypothetical protein [Endozoicomonas arenosclerae]|uniref:hypothetical protein n=1 Tax=Endozoicomonas arenosclerae TaxID=1633495 RepID=UPI00078222FF|nr:hypothetical protein [Endozoicomonas arenosclerae]